MSTAHRALALLAALASVGCLGEVVLADPPRPSTAEDAALVRADAAFDAAFDASADASLDARADVGLDAPDAATLDAGTPEGALGYIILGSGAPTATCTGALTLRGLDDTFSVRTRVDLVQGYGTWWPGTDDRLPELTGTFAVDNFAREPLVFSAADTITPDRLICEVDARDRVSVPDALVVVGTALIVERPNITPQSLPLRLRYIVENAPNAPYGRCLVDFALVTRAYP